MKIVFLIKRLNYYRFFYSVIKEALSRGIKVECWLNNDPKFNTGNKHHLFPEASRMPSFDPNPNIQTGSLYWEQVRIDFQLCSFIVIS